MNSYIVEADLTPFFDRWGSEHFRIIYEGKWLFMAYVSALLHCYNYPYGSAKIKKI